MITLTRDCFDPGAELSRFCQGRQTTGAIASFVGLARGEAGQDVALELEAYPGFTEIEIQGFAAQALAHFRLDDVAIIHRHGPIATGEPIVMVLTAAAHRRAAFDACDYLMDYLKSRAPFWKREGGPDAPRWIEPTVRDHEDLARWETSNTGDLQS